MKNIKLYLHDAKIEDVIDSSKDLFNMIRDKVFTIKSVDWDGKADSLPSKGPVLVNMPDGDTEEWQAIAEKCVKLGHVCFFQDSLVGSNGEKMINSALLEEVFRTFLKQK